MLAIVYLFIVDFNAVDFNAVDFNAVDKSKLLMGVKRKKLSFWLQLLGCLLRTKYKRCA